MFIITNEKYNFNKNEEVAFCGVWAKTNENDNLAYLTWEGAWLVLVSGESIWIVARQNDLWTR